MDSFIIIFVLKIINMASLMPFVFIPVLIIWFFYRLLIKKDIRNHKYEVVFGGIFIVLWVILYFLIKGIK